jgi:hypothetical protein
MIFQSTDTQKLAILPRTEASIVIQVIIIQILGTCHLPTVNKIILQDAILNIVWIRS